MIYSPMVIKRLIKLNLITGNYNLAKEYINLLLSSPVEKEWAKKYEAYIADTNIIAHDHEMMIKRRQTPLNLPSKRNIEIRYAELLEKDSTNRTAYQSLQLYHLLNFKVGDFIKNFDKTGMKYGPNPPVFEEAAILYIINTNAKDPENYNISNESQIRYQQFNDIMVKKYKKNIKQAMPELSNRFYNSYLYHLTYHCPDQKHDTQEQKQ